MIPSAKYRLVKDQGDYKKAHEFLSHYNIGKCVLSFPTVLAEEDGKVVGVVGTKKHPSYVWMDPFVVQDEKRNFTGLHLWEAYEEVLRMANVRGYIFFLRNNEERHEKMIEYLDRGFGIKPFMVQGNESWFKRELV